MDRNPVIDLHTHAFPDTIAEHAMEVLADTDGMLPDHNGTLAGLLESMDRAGIGRSVLCNIATRPDHFRNIFTWSLSIRSERIIPLPSVHPRDTELEAHIDEIAEAGFAGIKIHPYYQDFDLDDPGVFPMFRRLQEHGLVVVSHTGFDAAFPDRQRRADPERIIRVLDSFPDLLFVATHLGAWQDWDEVERLLVGRPVRMEISYAFGEIPDARIRDILTSHPRDFLFFGTDSPWTPQKATLDALLGLNLPEDLETAILRDNAAALLKPAGKGRMNG